MRDRRHKRGSDLLGLLGVLGGLAALLALLVFGLWAHFAGPCSLYKYSRLGDVPARCVMHR